MMAFLLSTMLWEYSFRVADDPGTNRKQYVGLLSFRHPT